MRLRLPRPRTGRRGVVIGGAVIVVVLGLGIWLVVRPGASQAQATPITYTVSKTTVKQTVSASGTLAAKDEADLDFAVSGTVTKVLVHAGEKVTKGQVLAEIDPTTLRASYTSAAAALTAADTEYSDDADDDAGSTQLASDQAQIASAKATLSQAAANLADAKLRSTLSGTVASRDLDVGDTVAGGSSGSSTGSGGSSTGTGESTSASTSSGSSTSSSTSSSSAFVVVKPGHFTISADVDADEIASVKKGMQAQITPSGSSTTIFGTVASVSMVADTSDEGTATFPVTIDVTGVQKSLYAGTSVTVSIITKELSNVLVVPALALSSSGGSTYVEKVQGPKTVKTKVTVGQTFGAQTQITSGLASGDKVQLAVGGFTRTTTSGSGNGETRTYGGGFGGGTGGFSGGSGGGFGGGFGGGQ